MNDNARPGAEADLGTYPSTPAAAQQMIDESMAGLAERLASIKDRRQQAMGTTASATSRDGRVRVTVDATGVLTDLALAQNAFEDTTPEKLGRTVLATAQQAASSARTTMRDAMDEIRGGDTELSAVRARAREMLGDLSLPEVPRTATDPTGMADQWSEGAAAPAPDPDASFDEQLNDLGEPSGNADGAARGRG